MEKLVLIYHWGYEECSGTAHIAFEYESKDKFVFDVLEKFKNKEWEVFHNGEWNERVEIMPEVYLDKSEIENIEYSIFTLEDWFNRQKIEVVIT